MSKLGSNNETDSLEEFFSGKLKNESMVPSDKVWQQIEGSLSQDKKRRRRFIWLFFSSLFFIATGIATYVVMGNHAAISLSKINNVKNKTAATTVDIKTPAETAVTENNISTKTNITSPEKENIAAENAGREEKVSTVKIQLGAFKKQIDKSMFDKTGLDIKQETNENGITRYYAEVPENQKPEALQKAQHAGFADAFVREDMLLAVKNSEAKNIIPAKPVTQPAAALLATKNTEAKNKTKNITLANVPVVAPTKNSKPVVNDTKNTNNELPVASNNHTAKNDVAKTENVKADETKQTANTKIASTNTNSVAETNKPPEEIIPGAAIVKQDDVAKTDSVVKAPDENIPPPVAATDSIKTEEKKKDEPIAKKDSLPAPPMPLTERWALLFTGGPNLCIKNSSNSLFNIAGEKQPVTYNAAFKAEYKLVRNLSVSAGLNYSYFTAQQDVTLLYFNRFQTTDFIFYSSYGPMAVSMSNMLQGYNPGPGITTLKINYSYTSKLNTLQIPLEAKWYFANTAKINLYTALGGNVMFVLSEQTKLTTINEHVTNTYTFNQVNSSKFNILLMLGLGGDVRLYKKLYFTIDGGFRYGAVNLSTAVGARTYPTYFSINGGLKFKL